MFKLAGNVLLVVGLLVAGAFALASADATNGYQDDFHVDYSPSTWQQADNARPLLAAGVAQQQQQRPAAFLSRSNSFPNLERYAKQPEMTLPKPHQNKVSAALRFLHNKSAQFTYAPTATQASRGAAPTVAANGVRGPQEPNYFQMSDLEVLKSACTRMVGICHKTVQTAMQKSPATMAAVAQSIRNKPANVKSDRLLMHKLLESAIVSVESRGIDEKLNKVINTAAKRNPYLYMASKTLDRVGSGKF